MIRVLKDNRILYLVWLFMLLCIAVGVVTTTLLSIAAMILFAWFLLRFSTLESCILLFGLLPFANLFKLSPGTISFFTICELLVAAASVFRNRKIKSAFLLSLVLFAAYIFVTDIAHLDLLRIVKLVAGFYLIYIITLYANQDSLVNIAYMLAGSTVIMIFLSLNGNYFEQVESYLLDLNYLLDSSGHASDVLRLSGFFGDPNYCSVLIVMTVSLLSTLYYHKKIKTEFWVFLLILIPAGFLTYSKSYFLCAIVLLFFLLVFVLLPKHRGWAIASMLAFFVVAFMALQGRIAIINTIINRFIYEDFSTGRFAVNEIYLAYIWDNPKTLLFGDGITADLIKQANNNVHNIYIEALLRLGIVGSVLLVTLLANSLNQGNLSKGKRKAANFIPLMFLAVLYFALAGLVMYELPFYLSIVFLAVNCNLLPDY